MRTGASGNTHKLPPRFDDGHDLDTVLAEHPRLLAADDALSPILACRHLPLADAAGSPLVLIDSESVPIIVETDSAGPEDRGRTMVARALDDLCALARLTAEQVDLAADGGVVAALREIAGDDRDELSCRWAAFAANLAAVRVRVVLAVAKPWPELAPLVTFVAEHTRFDVQCIAVSQARESNGDTVYASTTLTERKRPQLSARRDASRAALRLVRSAAGAGANVAVRHRHSVSQPASVSRFDLARVRWDG